MYKAIVLLFEEGTCKSPVCKRHRLKASGSVEQSLKTPVLVYSLFHLNIFTPPISPLWTFFSSSPHSQFCCHGFSFFALIHTFYSHLECAASSPPPLQFLFTLQTLKNVMPLLAPPQPLVFLTSISSATVACTHASFRHL